MLKGEVYMWRGNEHGVVTEDYTTAKNAIAGSEKYKPINLVCWRISLRYFL